MKKRLIKPISFNNRHFQIGNIFFNENDKWYIQSNRENDEVPSFININDKEYFEDVIERKYNDGDIVVYNNKFARVESFSIFRLYRIIFINKSSYTEFTEVTEKEIKNIDEYYFINTFGNIHKSQFNIDKNTDIFRFKSNNMFINEEEANNRLNKIMSR